MTTQSAFIGCCKRSFATMRLSALTRLLPHALAIDVALTQRDEENQQLVALLNSASEYLLRAEAGKRAVDVATRASACALAVLGAEHSDTLRARANLAASYHAVGRAGESIEL